ncbi:hypothetical protein Pla52o_21200 [Novipirellula galeiformis]|uniref:Uncharacterized protein n=1 Tax=Novipirellula galeiformis TaxID=2528004 RepID=A0A5C6CL77_9BACT|nr:hypothetical protein [Novipirellula galeiformis]TWU24194.1 hypothetical protein Pla52o_21200 [Novipirellula galeiformis]
MLPLSRRSLFVSVCCGAMLAGTSQAGPPNLMNMFRSGSQVEADVEAEYMLSQEDGPWMILASTCVGEGSKARAHRLAFEIRRDLNMPAFIYREKFDFTGSVGKNQTGGRRLRYANEYQYDAYAVLVGEYDRVEHEGIDQDLQKLKSARLPIFEDKEEIAKETSTASPVTTVRAITRKLMERRNDKTLGPMANAFVTRNPMLPEDYFDAPEVDSFVQQLNEGKDYSLLSCKGKYTVVVATFEGLGTIVDGHKEKNFTPSGKRLDKMAADAGKMAAELRKQGIEAYQFHDRTRSLVTIGSFPSLGRELPDAKFEYDPEIRRVMETYRAFNSQKARYVPGHNGVAVHHAALIPFDVNPVPIAVPRTSKRSLYSSALGRR